MLLAVALLCGCGHAVKHTVSPDYERVRPRTVAVVPVIWGQAYAVDENAEAARTFDGMIAEKLRSLGYKVTALDKADKRIEDLRALANDPGGLASSLGVDTVLYPQITGWDVDRLATYASTSLKARFSLYSADGTKLWKAEYDTKDFDIKLDSRPLELAVIEAYEPRMQRFIDIVFSTLPRSEAPAETEKRFFDWLP